jgi:prepilin-type N-terminal cleavage/methylation domain-containing protein
MSLKNIKSNSQAKSGFTIVELLIVVVVIAILAAITIVSYNGITKRANGASAKATASTLQKKAELYAADGPTSKYPFTLTELTSATSDKTYAVSNSIFTTTTGAQGALTADNGKNSVRMYVCSSATPTAANITGLRIAYFDYEGTSAETTSANSINVGSGSTCALATY